MYPATVFLLNRISSMASTTASSFTLPPTPVSRLNFPYPPSKTFPLFPRKFRRSRVFVTGARPIRPGGGSGEDNESPSVLKQRRGVHPKNDGEILVSYNRLPRILKPLASIMLFGSADCDQNRWIEERRRDLVLQYLAYNHAAILSEKEYYRHLAGVLKEWHTGVQEQEEGSTKPRFRRLHRFIFVIRSVGNFFSFDWTWQMPWFEFTLLLCFVGVVISVVAIFLLPFFIWKFLFNRPPPPPSPPPINPSVVKKVLPFINPDIVKKWLPIDPNTVVEDLLQFINPGIVKNWLPIDLNAVKYLLPSDKVKLVMLATQLKVFIPMLIMAAAVK